MAFPAPARPSYQPAQGLQQAPMPGSAPMNIARPPSGASPGNAAQVNGRQAIPAYAPPQGQPPVAPPPANARVLIELDGKIIGVRQLNKPVLTVGRLSGNDVQVPNQRVSRHHAKITYENGIWVIEDADSVNGLVYQGNRIDRLALSEGDRIYIAPTAVLRYTTRP